MKTTITTLLLIIYFSSFGQTKKDENVGTLCEFTENLKLKICDAIGSAPDSKIIKSVGNDSLILETGDQFYVAGVPVDNEDYYYIHVLFWNSDDADAKAWNKTFFSTTGSEEYADVYFLLPKTYFVTRCKPRLLKNSFAFGIVNLPIKMRFGSSTPIDGYNRNFLLAGDVSLGTCVGYKHRWTENWAGSALFGFSLSSIVVDSSTTKGYFKSANNASALTTQFGLVVENRNFQMGIFTGIDFMSGDVGKEWIYKDQPWIGIGLGYSLITFDKAKNQQDK